MYVIDYLLINVIVFGKKVERFWDSWFVIGICMYLKLLFFVNLFGILGVIFKMYLILYFFSKLMFVEFLVFFR